MRLKLSHHCIPCFQEQTLQAVRFINGDEDLQEHVLREVMKRLIELKWDLKPIEIVNEVHKMVRRVTRVNDPYETVKKSSNDLFLTLYPRLKTIVKESETPPQNCS